jgi:hypothetical protein
MQKTPDVEFFVWRNKVQNIATIFVDALLTLPGSYSLFRSLNLFSTRWLI